MIRVEVEMIVNFVSLVCFMATIESADNRRVLVNRWVQSAQGMAAGLLRWECGQKGGGIHLVEVETIVNFVSQVPFMATIESADTHRVLVTMRDLPAHGMAARLLRWECGQKGLSKRKSAQKKVFPLLSLHE